MKKKILIPILVIAVLILAGAGIFYWRSHSKDEDETKGEKVYVESVADITGAGYVGMEKFMGVVESQEVKYVDKASDKKVSEIFVEEGAAVNEGDKLFEYDTDDMALKLKQLQLELTSINNNITTINQQINTLTVERDAAPAEEKIDYTTQIQALQVQINQLNYDASSKQLEIDRQKKDIENSVVYAPVSGTIKKINNSDNNSNPNYNGDYGYDYGYGSGGSEDDNHFISIIGSGNYRVKCTANEIEARNMFVGDMMIVRSRFDESRMWTGTISLVDLEHPTQNNDYFYGGGEVTKYPFYIELDSTDDLMLGEHLYAEYDYGQGEVKEGLWLFEYYIFFDDGNAYVWAEDKDGKIEKRELTLGDYDDYNMSYEIVSGLSTEDYIAFPEERIKEGMKTTTNYEDVIPDIDYGDDYIDDGMYEDDFMIDDGMYEDDFMIDDGMYQDDIIIDEETGEVMIPKDDVVE